jgi:hypothetical protein
MPSSNGKDAMSSAPLELHEVVHIETTEGATLTFTVVGILEDPQASVSYAVLMSDGSNDDEDSQFIVTDLQGTLLEDDAIAQEILDEFLAEAGDEDEEIAEEPS